MFDYGTMKDMYDGQIGSGLVPVDDVKRYAKVRKDELVGLILNYTDKYTEQDLRKKKLATLERIWETV